MAEAKLAPAMLSRPGRLDGLAANWKSDRVQVLWAFGFAGLGVCGARRSTSSFAGRGPPATGGSPRQNALLTMEVRRQLVAAGGNGFGLFLRLPAPTHLP